MSAVLPEPTPPPVPPGPSDPLPEPIPQPPDPELYGSRRGLGREAAASARAN